MSFLNWLFSSYFNFSNQSPDERLDKFFQVQQQSLFLGFLAAGCAAFSVIMLILIGGITIDRMILLAFIGITFGLLLTIRTLVSSMQFWRIYTRRLVARTAELLTEHDKAVKLQQTIEMIPEGWMYSFGVMNVSRHNQPNRTGPTAFLWRPDLLVKEGKIESRAVMGEGETLDQALLNGIEQLDRFS